jgi:ribosomal protein L11 methylase PrmA
VTVGNLQRDPASFRDPSGTVFSDGSRILRTVSSYAADAYRGARDSGVMARLVSQGQLLPFTEVDAGTLPSVQDAALILEHPRLDLISYPYEWCFAAHRSAALLHLDVHLAALDAGINLSDASAYNVQFRGARPVFIDHLSFRPYQQGEVWAGHRQFCMQFLNPLLMHSIGVAPNAWFRGALEGIPPEDLARLLPLPRKLSWTVLSHVVLQAAFQRSARRSLSGQGPRRAPTMPLASLKGMLTGLRRYIEDLRPRRGATEWSGYASDNSYSSEEAAQKRAFVADMVGKIRPAQLWDLGCNTGDFSALALQAGATRVIGWDYDHGALDQAFARAEEGRLAFLPLWLDAANPSPDQGWAQQERRGLASRSAPDALIALAFIITSPSAATSRSTTRWNGLSALPPPA